MLNVVAEALLPPASFAVLAFVLLLCGPRWRRAGLVVLAVLVALGTPLVSGVLLNSLAPAPTPPGAAPGAIVILSADGTRIAGQRNLDPGLLTLDRLRAGAALHRQTGLPILVSGGPTLGPGTLAAMMVSSLEQDFQVPVRWREDRSLDTWHNAEYSAAILQGEGIKRIYLVTHFWHMRRALLAFRHFGFDPVPAPVRPPGSPELSLPGLIPQASAWQTSYYAVHEWVGLAYYTLRSTLSS